MVRKASGPDRAESARSAIEDAAERMLVNAWGRGIRPCLRNHDLSSRSSFLGVDGVIGGATARKRRRRAPASAPALSRPFDLSMQNASGAAATDMKGGGAIPHHPAAVELWSGRPTGTAMVNWPESDRLVRKLWTPSCRATGNDRNVCSTPAGAARRSTNFRQIVLRRHSQCPRFVGTRALRSSKS